MTTTKKVYIHAGYYKTGTTAIQSYCAEHVDLLAKAGINYVSAGRIETKTPVNHSALGFDALHRAGQPTPKWYNFLGPKFDSNWQDVRDEIEQSPLPIQLISSEDFLALTLDETRTNVLEKIYEDYLKNLDIKVIFYLRRPDLYLESWYSQLIKSGMLSQPLHEVHGKRFAPLHSDFSLPLDIFARYFGSPNIVVNSYEGLKGEQLFKSFFTNLNVDFGPFTKSVSGWLSQKSQQNIGLPPIYIEIIRMFNAYYPERNPEILSKLIKFLPELSIKPEHQEVQSYLQIADRKKILSEAAPMLQKITDTYCGGQPLFEPPDFRALSDTIIQLTPADAGYYLSQGLVYLLNENEQLHRPVRSLRNLGAWFLRKIKVR